MQVKAMQLGMAEPCGCCSLADLGAALDLWENMSRGFSCLFAYAWISVVPRAVFSPLCRWCLSLRVSVLG